MLMAYVNLRDGSDAGEFVVDIADGESVKELTAEACLVIRELYEKVSNKAEFKMLMTVAFMSGVMFKTKHELCDFAEETAMTDVNSETAQELLKSSFDLRQALEGDE